MARGAADAFVDVNAVVEIDIVGQTMHAHPFDGFIRAITLAHGFQVTGVAEQHGMTIHARFGGRNAGGGGAFHGGMTVTAIDALLPPVLLLPEPHRLPPPHPLSRHITT